MSGKRRPRGVCPECGKTVALHWDASLWDHQRPGWGMWEDEGSCRGSRKKVAPIY